MMKEYYFSICWAISSVYSSVFYRKLIAISNTVCKVHTMTGHRLVLVCQSLKIRKQKSQNANIVYRDKNWLGSNFVFSNLVCFANSMVFAMIHSYLCRKTAKMFEQANYLVFNISYLAFSI